MDILTLRDYIECPQCGSDEEVIYTEFNGVITIDCSACGYFEVADFIVCSEENEDESYITTINCKK